MKNKKIISFIILLFTFFGIGSPIFNSNNTVLAYSTSSNSSVYKKIDKALQKFFDRIRYSKMMDTQKIAYLKNLEKKIEKIKKKKKSKLLDYIAEKVKKERESYYKPKIEKEEDLESSILNLLDEKKENSNSNASLNIVDKKYSTEKNNKFKSFSQSKRALEKIYRDKKLEPYTVYSNCKFKPDTKKVLFESCGYRNDGRYVKRSQKIEWEHIVPAENFGKSFESWRNPSKFEKCKKKKGGYYSSRTCAEKVSPEFRQMESDIYNLYPAVGALNALRSNYQIAEIPGETRQFGTIDFEIRDRKVEPPQNMKGDIARVYLYMYKTYGKDIIGSKNKKLIDAWNKLDPISKEECEVYKVKKEIQGNVNAILEETCKKINR